MPWIKQRTDHRDVPWADEMDVFHQVLPGQQTPEVSMQFLPQNQCLLVTSLQTVRNINIAQTKTVSMIPKQHWLAVNTNVCLKDSTVTVTFISFTWTHSRQPPCWRAAPGSRQKVRRPHCPSGAEPSTGRAGSYWWVRTRRPCGTWSVMGNKDLSMQHKTPADCVQERMWLRLPPSVCSHTRTGWAVCLWRGW